MADPVEHAAGPHPDLRPGPEPAPEQGRPDGPPAADARARGGSSAAPLRPVDTHERVDATPPAPPRGGPAAAGGRSPGWYRRAVAVGVAAALAVPAAHGALWFDGPVTGPAGSRAAVAPPSSTGTAGSPGGQVQTGDVAPPPAADVADLLARRAAAVTGRDRAAWLSTVDAQVPGLSRAQGDVFDRIDAVRPASWRYEVLAPEVALTDGQRAALPAGAVLARVRLAYRLARNAPEIRREQHLTLVQRDRWLVAGTDDGPQQRDLWDLGPVTVARGSRSVVVAAAPSPLPASRTAEEADAAARRVDDVWGTDWARTSVVFVPADAEQMSVLLGRSSTDGLDRLAAVTAGETGARGATRTTGDRIVLNPTGFAELTATGRGVVLTHELTHVATRSSTRVTPPLWVDEGFADYVAYLGTSLRPRDLAADLLDSPRALAALKALPLDEDFDPTQGPVGVAYAEAWLAMRFVAQQGGTERVVDFYRVATGLPTLRSWPRADPPRASLRPRTPLERACLEVLGFVEPSFVRRWVAYVRAVAARS